jgi:hypothetical protein
MHWHCMYCTDATVCLPIFNSNSTEGDAFILAFHNASDALSCAMEVQCQLLKYTWDERLFVADSCAPVYTTLVCPVALYFDCFC